MTGKSNFSIARRQAREAAQARLDAATVELTHENGVPLRRLKPSWALGVAPQQTTGET